MEDPVMDKCAHNFERAAIEEWIVAGQACCPISRKDLTVADLVPNHTLAERIEKWQWQQEVDTSQWRESEQTETASFSFSDDECEGGASHDRDLARIPKAPVDGDEEKGQPATRKSLCKLKYHEIPSKYMLLPQERAALSIARARSEEHRLEQRRRTFGAVVLGVCLALVFIVVGLGVAKYVAQTREEDNDEVV
jgi:U-box domain